MELSIDKTVKIMESLCQRKKIIDKLSESEAKAEYEYSRIAISTSVAGVARIF